MTVYSLPLPWDTLSLSPSHTHTHTHVYTIWPTGSGPAVKCSHPWANSVGRWPSVETKSHEGWPGQTPWKNHKTTQTLQGGSHEVGVRRHFCLDTDRRPGEITVNSVNLLSYALWESHTLQHTHTRASYAWSPPPPRAPPRNKECEWRPTWTKWRRKKRGGIRRTDLIPLRRADKRSCHTRTSITGRAGSESDTEGMLGEEEEDDVQLQQRHLNPLPTLKPTEWMIFVLFRGLLCMHSGVLCIKHLKLERRSKLTGGRE